MTQRGFLTWLTVAVALLAHASLAITPADRPPVRNFDRRRAVAPSTFPAEISANAQAAAITVRSRLRETRIDHDRVTGAPRFIGSTRRFLTGPDGEGGAVPASAARSLPAADRWRGLKGFLAEHRALFGHGPEILATAPTQRDYTDPQNGLRTAVWQQELDGVPIFQAVLKAHTTARGELVNVASGFVPEPAAAAERATPGRAARMARPTITAAQAVAIAASGVGDVVAANEIVSLEAAAGAVKRQSFQHRALSGVTADYAWLPMDRQTLRLCWRVIFTSLARGEMFLVLVDATTGEAQVRQGLTHYVSPATYNVFTSDSPSPFSPGHLNPSSVQPPLVGRTLVTTAALDLTASPNGWIDDGVNETRGNNVAAHTDTDANDVADLPRPQGSPNRVFNPPLDLTQAPSANRNAAVVQLFYLNNLIHDRFYQLGFTEAAGNFQNNNFGRGGAGNDAIQADAQDGSGTDNANFSTPPDGTPGRMQMFVFSGPNPDRDGDFDAEIVIHEYTHGLSNRLVGGGVGISNLQPGGMGEGWSDFYGLCLLSEPGDAPDGNFAAGGYATYQLGGMTENYYYGIRRYPYSTNLAKNPLTFKDIDPSQARSHANIPRSPVIGNTANAVHNIGEVWCVMLWEARARLIERYGHAVGNELILRLVTDGMKLSPANPTFVEARDAILQADAVNTGGANLDELWAAFARRGLGSSAVAPPSTTTTGVVEAFDAPDTLEISPATGLTSSGSVGGPFTPADYNFILTNTGETSLDWAATQVPTWLTLVPAAGTLAGSASVTVSATPNAAVLTAGGYQDTIVFFNTATRVFHPRQVTLTVLPPRARLFDLSTDPGWSRQGQWAFGDPTGVGGASFGFPDPQTGATGANVLGVNLAGDYSLVADGPFFLTTGPIDLSGRQQTRLRFQRWLNTDYQPFATARVEVSRNGTTWIEVFNNGTASPIEDSAWTAVDYDISAVADRQATVFVRWSYTVGSGAFAYSGWNLDDIEFLGESTQTLTVTLPAAGSEGGAPLTGTLTVSPVPTSALTVNLTSSDPSELGVPASVVVPAGAASVNFTATIIDDGLLDGSQTVAVTPAATNYSSILGRTVIHDRSTATLTLDLPASVSEGSVAALGRVLLGSAATAAVLVSLSSNNPAELAVPPAVLVPAGATTAAFPLQIADDDQLSATRSVTITAQVVNWTPASHTLSVLDNDMASLALTLPAQTSEGQGTASGVITLNAPRTTPLAISLASDNPAAATVPATVTVPANTKSVFFTINVVNDNAANATRTTTITATAAGFVSAAQSLAVLNDDADHFGIATIPSPQFAGTPFALIVTAYDAAGAPMPSFAKPLTVAASASGVALNVTPSTINPSGDGFIIGSVAVTPSANAVTLTVRDDTGRSAASNPVNIVAGTPDYFTELFVADNDVDNQSFLFVPTGTLNGYVVRRQPTTAFFTDPAGGTPLALGDDTFVKVTPTNGASLLFYGIRYPELFVSSNGCVTFRAGDIRYEESLATHFALPRIAALLDDLNPLQGGQVTLKQLPDRLAITWQAVPEYDGGNANSFQIEVFFDGRYRITLLALAATDGLIGLSRGTGVPGNFVESNFITYPTQGPPGISELNDLAVLEDGATPALAFTVFDVETAAANLVVTRSSSNPALVPVSNIVLSGSGTNRAVQVTPLANRSGTAVITLTVTDGNAMSGSEVFAVNVTPVNDPPVFAKGADPTVNEDSGLRTLGGWATGMSAGPLETGQTLTFEVSNDQSALFTTPPAISANGTLSFQSAPNVFGKAEVTVRLRDNGGTANGGLDTTAGQTFTINIAPVNDAPWFAAGPAGIVDEDSGPQTIAGWATALSPGPVNEREQALSFLVSTDLPALFATPPAIAPDGTLTFTPAADAFGSATITVRARDDGGTANGGADTSAPQSVIIQVLPINDPPTLAALGGLALLEDAAPQSVALAGLGSGALNEIQPLAVTAMSSNPALVPHPIVSYTSPQLSGSLTLQAASDRSGLATITVTIDDGQGLNHATQRSFEVVVQGVNDAASFVAGPAQIALEDSGPQIVAEWAKAISAGPADEAAQTLSFIVTTNNEALFAQQPAVSPEGTLSFTPAPDANGQATVTVVLRDSGGTNSGGVETSAPQTFTIDLTPVNDAPAFTLAGNQAVTQDAGPKVVQGFARAISAGAPDEFGQRLTFLVSSDEPALFAVPPAISPSGTLSYVPRPEASGTTTVTVRLRDNGDTANGGVNTSVTQTFTIAVTTFAEETGSYHGLALPAPEAQPGAEKTGLLRLTLARRGAFTGRMKLGRGSVALRGVFDKAGVARFRSGSTTLALPARDGQLPLAIELRLDVSGGSGQLTGTITEAGALFAVLTANRALYSSAAQPQLPFRRVPEAILGPYTVLFSARSPATSASTEGTALPGDGFGRIMVTTNGNARLVGRLADGSVLSYANALSKANVWPLWIPFARGAGALAGQATFRAATGLREVGGEDLSWFKPAAPQSTQFPLGWPDGLRVELIGSAYQRQLNSCVLPDLGEPDRIGNALIQITAGDTVDQLVTQPVNINARNQVLVVAPDPQQLRTVITPRNGWFRGSFIHPDSGQFTRFQGAILQKQRRGSGYFSTAGVQGGVSLLPAAATPP